MNKKQINIDFDLLKEQRDELLGHVWHDSDNAEPINETLVWGVIDLLDALLDNHELEKNKVYR